MTTRAETWSLWRLLAFMAALFAIVLGSLLPSAAMAASHDGRPIVMCSAQGPKVIRLGGDGDPTSGLRDARCADCVMTPVPDLPPPPIEPTPPLPPIEKAAYSACHAVTQPRVRLAPKPPSTAPPLN